ncbi:MAG: hypothetical protein WCR42_12585 [bacterium]
MSKNKGNDKITMMPSDVISDGRGGFFKSKCIRTSQTIGENNENRD